MVIINDDDSIVRKQCFFFFDKKYKICQYFFGYIIVNNPVTECYNGTGQPYLSISLGFDAVNKARVLNQSPTIYPSKPCPPTHRVL